MEAHFRGISGGRLLYFCGPAQRALDARSAKGVAERPSVRAKLTGNWSGFSDRGLPNRPLGFKSFARQTSKRSIYRFCLLPGVGFCSGQSVFLPLESS